MVSTVSTVSTMSSSSPGLSSFHDPKNSVMLPNQTLPHTTLYGTFTHIHLQRTDYHTVSENLNCVFVLSFCVARTLGHVSRLSTQIDRLHLLCSRICKVVHRGDGHSCSCSESYWKTEITAANKNHRPKHFTCAIIISWTI